MDDIQTSPLPTLKIINLVATFQLPTSLTVSDYTRLAALLHGADYRPKRYHALILRAFGGARTSGTRNGGTAIIYRSGKCVLAGAGKCHAEVETRAERVAQIVANALHHRSATAYVKCENVGTGVGYRHFRLVNVVATTQLPYRVKAEHLVGTSTRATHTDGMTTFAFDYDPTIFPGIHCRVMVANNNTSSSSSEPPLLAHGGNNKETKVPTLTMMIFANGKCILTGVSSIVTLQCLFEKFFAFMRTTHSVAAIQTMPIN
jgi:TATA-box binding protein (TBP) (component of TFIID and TFIIIB)